MRLKAFTTAFLISAIILIIIASCTTPIMEPTNPFHNTSVSNSQTNETNSGANASSEYVPNPIRIASFNIRNFNDDKVSMTNAFDVLAAIITNFDIVAIQEIGAFDAGDKDNSVMPAFLARINSISDDEYKSVVSEIVGPSSGYGAERYAFVYKSFVKTTSNFVYSGALKSTFSRPPFCAYFKAGEFDFVLLTVHTKPDNATEEIAALTNVMEVASNYFSEPDVIALGDFNAGGSYFDYGTTNALRQTNIYSWVIPDETDTTISDNNEYTYDRIVFFRSNTMENYGGGFGVLNYTVTYGSNISADTNINIDHPYYHLSDHYPVWAMFFTDSDYD